MSLKHEFHTRAKAWEVGAPISPSTAYKLLVPLRAVRERPGINSNRTTPNSQAVLAVREAHPAWGGRTIRKVLLYLHVPSPSTITGEQPA